MDGLDTIPLFTREARKLSILYLFIYYIFLSSWKKDFSPQAVSTSPSMKKNPPPVPFVICDSLFMGSVSGEKGRWFVGCPDAAATVQIIPYHKKAH